MSGWAAATVFLFMDSFNVSGHKYATSKTGHISRQQLACGKRQCLVDLPACCSTRKIRGRVVLRAHTRTYMRICTGMHTPYAYKCAYMCVCVCAKIATYILAYSCVYVNMNASVLQSGIRACTNFIPSICMYVCMYVYI